MLRPSSIRRWDSNSQPSDYESPPLTTRPGLPPKKKILSHQLRQKWCVVLYTEGGCPNERADEAGSRVPPELLPGEQAESGSAPQASGSLPHAWGKVSP